MRTPLDPERSAMYVGKPNLGDLDLFRRLTNEIFERRRFTNGGIVVREFEARLCEYLSVRHCIPVCNGTVGLQIAARALGLTGEVIMPAFTFVATAHALQWVGIKPVFCDIDPVTHNMDPTLVEALITNRTTGILGVHVWGRPCDTTSLSRIANEHNLALFFDAAHAFGCRHKGEMIGNFGLCEVFSFHATKFFNTFEGGAIATNDDELAAKIRSTTQFGFNGTDHALRLGTNAKMPEICAAMGLACFGRLHEIVDANRQNFLAYRAGLDSVRGIRLVEYSDVDASNSQYIVLEVDKQIGRLARDEFLRELRKRNIFARRYFYPGCHRMAPYATDDAAPIESLPCCDALCERVVQLPTGTAVTQSDVTYICDVVKKLMH